MYHSLKKRKEFVYLSKKGDSFSSSGLILQKNPDLSESSDKVQIGITITKKIGCAVIRNKVRRRIKSILRDVLKSKKVEQNDYVFIARKRSVERSYHSLRKDVLYLLYQSNSIRK